MQTRFLFTAALTAATIAAISSSIPPQDPNGAPRPPASISATGALAVARAVAVSRSATDGAPATHVRSRSASEPDRSKIPLYLPSRPNAQNGAARRASSKP